MKEVGEGRNFMRTYGPPSSLLQMICRGDNVMVLVFAVLLTGKDRARLIKAKKQRVVELKSCMMWKFSKIDVLCSFNGRRGELMRSLERMLTFTVGSCFPFILCSFQRDSFRKSGVTP